MDEIFKSVDMNVIKRIVVYGSPEKESVLEIFDKLIANALLQRLDRFLKLIRLRKPSFLKEE
ncbi:MAG: hypothetical protein ACFFCD_06095 [Promethearchaeota archaeon]